MYFRTEKNKYNIDIIVATETDATLVSSTGNVWIETSDPDCAVGAYWHNGDIIAPGSDEYNNIIAPIIADAKQADADAAAATAAAEQQAIADAIAASEALVEAPEINNEPIETPLEDLDLDTRKTISKRFPKSKYVPIREEQDIPAPTPENLALWEEILADTRRTIEGVENDTDPDPQIVRFPEPITYLEGTEHEHTKEFILLPDEDKADYLAHMRIVEADQAAFVEYLKEQLGV
jgi:hypothetical protein